MRSVAIVLSLMLSAKAFAASIKCSEVTIDGVKQSRAVIATIDTEKLQLTIDQPWQRLEVLTERHVTQGRFDSHRYDRVTDCTKSLVARPDGATAFDFVCSSAITTEKLIATLEIAGNLSNASYLGHRMIPGQSWPFEFKFSGCSSNKDFGD